MCNDGFVVDTIYSYGSYDLIYSRDTTPSTRDNELQEFLRGDINSMNIQVHISTGFCDIPAS